MEINFSFTILFRWGRDGAGAPELYRMPAFELLGKLIVSMREHKKTLDDWHIGKKELGLVWSKF